jgi:hypothetical protein
LLSFISTSIALFKSILTPEEKAERVIKALRLTDFADYDPKIKTKPVSVTHLGSGKLKGVYSFRNEIEKALRG